MNAMRVTVAYAAPGIEALVPVDRARGRDRRRRRRGERASSTRFALGRGDLATRSTASVRAADTPLADGDRVELTRPLVADPKASAPRACRRTLLLPPDAARSSAVRSDVSQRDLPVFATAAGKSGHNSPRMSARLRPPLRARPSSSRAHAARIRRTRSRSRRRAAETAGKVWTGAQDVAVYALGLIGVDYKFGGNTPDTGLDCSGLVRYVFQEVTGVTLPRTAKEMSGIGAKVGVADLKPGDLVFFNTRRFAFSHVGIYLGDNRFIHAPSRGSEVAIARAVRVLLAEALQRRAPPRRRAAVARAAA